jgi:hypothetical protein
MNFYWKDEKDQVISSLHTVFGRYVDEVIPAPRPPWNYTSFGRWIGGSVDHFSNDS